MLAQPRGVGVEGGPLRFVRQPRIGAKQPIAQQARVDMEVKVRNLLVGGWTHGVPDGQTLVRERGIDGTRDTNRGRHDRGGGRGIQLQDVGDVSPRDDEGVAGVKLAPVHESNRRFILEDDAGRFPTGYDTAE